MRNKFFLHTVASAVFFVTSFVFISCSDNPFCDEREVTLSLEVPDSYNAVTSWSIVYTDKDNVLCKKKYSSQQLHSSSTITLVLHKSCPIPVLAYPTSFSEPHDDTLLTKPLGAIVPYSTSLVFADGFAADILRTLYVASLQSRTVSQVQEYLSRFNWARLLKRCASYPDPWLLDKERILRAIANGSFKQNDIVLK